MDTQQVIETPATNRVARVSKQARNKAKSKQKVPLKKRSKDIEDIAKWGFEMDIRDCSGRPESRKIRLKKTTPKPPDTPKTRRKSKQGSPGGSARLSKLTFPSGPGNPGRGRTSERTREGLRRMSPFREELRRTGSDALSGSSRTESTRLDSDFFSKVEMMSRQSAPQNRTYPVDPETRQSPYSSLAHAKPSPAQLDDVDILISFGGALTQPNALANETEPDARDSTTLKRNFHRGKPASYFTQASQRWNWTNAYSTSTGLSRPARPVPASDDSSGARRSPARIKRTKGSLKEERLRLRAALKSIKF